MPKLGLAVFDEVDRDKWEFPCRLRTMIQPPPPDCGFLALNGLVASRWFRTTKNWDVSIRPLVCAFARTAHILPLLHYGTKPGCFEILNPSHSQELGSERANK